MRISAEPGTDALLKEVEDRPPLRPETLGHGEHPLDEAPALADPNDPFRQRTALRMARSAALLVGSSPSTLAKP